MTLYINPMRRTGRRRMMNEMMRDWDEGYTAELVFPINVKADKVEADLENGVLTLQIPKAEAAKPHTIKIKQK